jgi:hypothetical protein
MDEMAASAESNGLETFHRVSGETLLNPNDDIGNFRIVAG